MVLMDDLIGFSTVKTSKRITRLLNLKLKPYDVTAEQWTVLKRLYEVDNINQKDLSERTDKDQATLTKILDLLEKRELVIRKQNPEDRRSYLVGITSKGRQLTEELLTFVENIFTHIVENIPKEMMENYMHVLQAMNKNIENLKNN